VKISRRTLLKYGISGIAAGVGGISYRTLIEPQRLSLERDATRIPNLPAALEGFRIAVLSDFHLHSFTTVDYVQGRRAPGQRPPA
jgi:predicted MPP superfamily phosphohydrolase